MALVPLDKKDKKILNAFSNNARLSFNQISRTTKISKDSVRRRIALLEKKGVINGYFTLFNYAKLGLRSFVVYCKFNLIKHLGQKEISKLAKEKNISSVTWILGEYDLRLNILAKNRNELNKILNKIRISNRITSFKVLEYKSPMIYTTTLEGEKSKITLKMKEEEFFLDRLDKDILLLIGKNARIKTFEIAAALGEEEDRVRYKLKKLIEMGIITGFYVRTAKSSIGISRYLSLVSSKNRLAKEKEDMLRSLKNVYYLQEYKNNSQYFYELRFSSSSNEDFVGLIYKLKEIFLKEFEELKINVLFDIVKHDTTPYTALEN